MCKLKHPVHSKHKQGFSLIEITVVTAIIGILAAVAWPLYEQQSRKNNRTEAVRALSNASAQLEKCYLNATNGYTDCTYDTSSERGLYAITISRSADAYTLTATAQGSQAADTECTSLTFNNLGQRNYTGTAPNYRRCWGG